MSTNHKIDLVKLNKEAYSGRKKPFLLTVEPAQYLTIEGRGEPGGEQFQSRVGALYATAFTLKFTSKEAGRDYTVCKLESQWWADGCEDGNFSQVPPQQWRWKLLIRTPDFIGEDELAAAAARIRAKGKVHNVGEVRLERLGEGRCVQMLHLGPYDEESRTIAVMKAFAADQGLAFAGRHHEIYLSDPRRVEPARLRTILRLPVR